LYVDNKALLYLPLSGGTMTGDINMNNHEIFNVLYPTDPNSAINLNYLNNSLSNYLPQTGGTL
jgi:hypothetical protein